MYDVALFVRLTAESGYGGYPQHSRPPLGNSQDGEGLGEIDGDGWQMESISHVISKAAAAYGNFASFHPSCSPPQNT